MNKRFIFQMIVICTLVSGLCMPAAAARAKGTRAVPGTAIFVMAEQKEAAVQSKRLAVDAPYLKLEMVLPQFKGLKDKQFEKKLNQTILTEAKARQKNIIQLAKDYASDLHKDQLPVIQIVYLENYTPIESTAPYEIVELFKYQYSGGAHGISELSYIVLDTQACQQVALKDLFKENIDYQKLISQRVAAEIERRRQLGEFFFSSSEGFQSLRADQPFFINNKGDLVIVFNVYEIAPYAAGPQYILLSRQSLAPYLK